MHVYLLQRLAKSNASQAANAFGPRQQRRTAGCALISINPGAAVSCHSRRPFASNGRSHKSRTIAAAVADRNRIFGSVGRRPRSPWRRPRVADLCWTVATVPAVAGLAYFIVRDLLAGRMGVDAIALLAMAAALLLGEPLAGAVVALMYAGGNVLEDIAVSRAEHDLRLAGRSRAAHCASPPLIAASRTWRSTPSRSAMRVLVRERRGDPGRRIGQCGRRRPSGEIGADRRAVPVVKPGMAAHRLQRHRECRRSIRDDRVFESRAKAPMRAYVRLVTAAQTAKAPFARLADRYALDFPADHPLSGRGSCLADVRAT